MVPVGQFPYFWLVVSVTQHLIVYHIGMSLPRLPDAGIACASQDAFSTKANRVKENSERQKDMYT